MFLFSAAFATTPQQLQTTLDSIAPLRAKRQGTHAPAPPSWAYEKALAGEVASGVDDSTDNARKVWGVAIVDAPIGRYFSAINDDRNKTAYTKLDHVIVLDGQPCGQERVVFQHLPVPILTDRWWTIRQRINQGLQEASQGKVREMSWSPASGVAMTPEATAAAGSGTRVDHTYGGWFLVDLGQDRTLVEFWTWSDPGGVVPEGLAASFATKNVATTLGSMADLARRGPSCNL